MFTLLERCDGFTMLPQFSYSSPSFLVRLLFVFCLTYSAFSAQGETIRVSTATLNQQLATQFPLTRSFEEVEATFYAPKLVVKYLDEEVEIIISVKLVYQQQELIGHGLLKDTPSIQTVSNTLRFERPRLTEFYVDEDNMQDSAEALRVLKQTIGQSLRPLILLHFDEVEVSELNHEPASFSFDLRGLVLTF
jgi:hypothetical protein